MTLTELMCRRARRVRKCDPSGLVADHRYFVVVYLQDRMPICALHRDGIMQAIDTMQSLFPGLQVEFTAVMTASIVAVIVTRTVRASEAELAGAFRDLLVEKTGEETFRRIGYYELPVTSESVMRRLLNDALQDIAPGQVARFS